MDLLASNFMMMLCSVVMLIKRPDLPYEL